jgi:hypothetical protein
MMEGLWGLQKRGYLARTERQFFEEFIVDMVFKPGFGVLKNSTVIAELPYFSS